MDISELIALVVMLNDLEERLVSPHLAFAQMWQLHGYRQYSIRGSIIDVVANIDASNAIYIVSFNAQTGYYWIVVEMPLGI